MWKKVLSIFALIFSSVSLNFAQVSVCPEDEFYDDVIGWQLKEYIYYVPQVRPYPVNVVKSILDKVAVCGDKIDEERAKNYYEKFFNKPWNISASGKYTEVIQSIEKGETELKGKYSFNLYSGGDFAFNDYTGLSYSVGANLFNKNEELNYYVPYNTCDSTKLIIKGFSAYNDDLALTFDLNAAVSFGNTDTYVSFGVNKSSFGPFTDTSIVLGEQAYQTLNLTFNHTGKYLEYSHIIAAVTASDSFNPETFKFNKYYSFHSVRLPLFSRNAHVSYYETSVWGEYFMPGYFLPVPYVIMGNVSGFNENIMAGVLVDWQPFNCIKFSLNLNVDDLKPKEIIKLKLDSGLRTAFQAGIEYSPKDSICDLMTLNFTLANPYTYTSYYTNDPDYNYNNYQHMGLPIASDLAPNSDRISLGINFKPSNNFTIKTKTSFTRHANASQSLDAEEVIALNSSGKKYFSDGSLNTVDNGLDTACNITNFMTQGNKMYIIQGDLSFDYEFKIKKTQTLSLSCGYTFEFIQNYGIDRNIYTGNETTEADVDNSLNQWKNSLIDKYNHYFSVGLKYKY